ncbi:MAG: hypothetical protein WC791_01645 [Candidatus Paceibacterota bacterium]|jgi:hypothetical protein
MIPLNQLLDRFKNLTNSEKFKKQLVVEIFTKQNIPVKIEQVIISKNTIFLKVSPIIKTEMLFKREEILKEIQRISGFKNITNIQ